MPRICNECGGSLKKHDQGAHWNWKIGTCYHEVQKVEAASTATVAYLHSTAATAWLH